MLVRLNKVSPLLLKSRARKGIPDTMRGEAWIYLLGVNKIKIPE